MRLPALALAACWLAAGCAGESEGAGAADAPAAGLVEELRIDGVQHDLVPIGSQGGVAVRGDGVIALRQGQDSRVLFFAADGEPAGSFGGPGAGPGEFRGMGRMGWLADTLWVLDLTLRRMTLVAPDLTLARTVIVPMEARPAAADAGRFPSFPIALTLSPNPDGTFLAYLSGGIGQEVPEAFHEASSWGVLTGEGVVRGIHAISRVASDATVRTADGSVASVPFTNRTHYAVAPDGSRSAFAEALPGDAADSVGVMVFGAAGDTLYSRTYPFEAVPIPDATRDSVMRAHEQRLRASSPSLANAFRDQARVPARYPAVGMLLLGRDHSIWLERPVVAGLREYFVLDAEGTPVGTVALPANSRIAVGERDRVWVIERDENDVESVVRYRTDWRTPR